MIAVAAVTFWLFGLVAPRPEPVVQSVIQRHAARIGVDARNHLWLWNPVSRTVTRFSLTGEMLESGRLPHASAIDADAIRGIVMLSESGHEVVVVDWSGQVRREIPLRDVAGDVAWLEGTAVAVTPRFAGHRVEVWDVAAGTRVRTIGACEPIRLSSAGAVAGRPTVVRYDARRKEITTLDAYRGELIVFSPEGKEIRRAFVQHPKREVLERWLARRDAEAKAGGQRDMPMLWQYPTLARAADGTVWMGEQSDDSGAVHVVKVRRDGKVERDVLSSTCPSIRFTIWNDTFIFHRDPRSPQEICTGIRRK